MIKVTKVRALEGYRLRLAFSDGTVGIYDCSALAARNGPMLEPLQDPEFFQRVFLEYGAPTWPNGYDLAPWALHKDLSDAHGLTADSADAAE
jgi:Protein of unknown function (DUF2442)